MDRQLLFLIKHKEEFKDLKASSLEDLAEEKEEKAD